MTATFDQNAPGPSIAQELAARADLDYKAFQSKIIPTLDPNTILGVRTPALRSFAKDLAKNHPERASQFMKELPHTTLEENNLHSLLIGMLSSTPDQAFAYLDEFLPFVDNWATCDLIRVAAFKKDLPLTLSKIKKWISADPEYEVRFGIVQLMMLFLDDAFERDHLQLVVNISRREYYINMARAWYFSYALIKQPEATLPLFEQRPCILDTWTHNKSLQKARESLRITAEQKQYFQTLKVK